MTAGVYDFILAGALLFLTIFVLRARDVLTGIILFIIFGMLVSLAWLQLKAPDIALVEAIIGSALTGALFLGSLGHIERGRLRQAEKEAPQRKKTFFYPSILILLAVAVVSMMLVALSEIQLYSSGLTYSVVSVLERTGVKNPVTAVVLNIRGYDTFLEIGVLFLTAIAIFVLNGVVPLKLEIQPELPNPIIRMFVLILSPLMIVIAFYLFWVGAHAPGGAFQAGSMLAGMGILLLICGLPFRLDAKNFFIKVLCCAGFLVFLLIGLGGLPVDRHILEFPTDHAKVLIFVIEFAATISIGMILMILFAGCAGFLKRDEV